MPEGQVRHWLDVTVHVAQSELHLLHRGALMYHPLVHVVQVLPVVSFKYCPVPHVKQLFASDVQVPQLELHFEQNVPLMK